VNFSTGSAFGGLVASEFSGLATSSALDQHTGTTGSGTAANSGNITTTQANELLFAQCDGDYQMTGGTAGWTAIYTNFPWVQYMQVSSTGTYAATCTQTASGNWASLIASYKAAAPPTGTASISSGNTACATVGNSSPVQINALNVSSNCTSTITSVVSGVSNATQTLNVTAATTDTSIIIIPNPQFSLSVGTSQSLQAIGNVTGQPYNATWGISPSGFATISPLTGTSTLASCPTGSDAHGPYTINATFSGLTSGDECNHSRYRESDIQCHMQWCGRNIDVELHGE
jgi:hypothetical protein